MVELTVRAMDREDVFEDMARVHLSHRPFAKAGAVFVIHVNGRKAIVTARGAPKNSRSNIHLDLETRKMLCVELNKSYDFEFLEADCLDEICWAWRATSAMPRIAARLAILSTSLGCLSILLGVVSFFLGLIALGK